MGELLDILYEDNHLIALNKRAGDLVQGDKTGDKPLPDLIKTYIKDKYNKPGNVFCGVIHRLDRPTTGIVLFARTSKGLERMNAAFKNRETQSFRAARSCERAAVPPAREAWLVTLLASHRKGDGPTCLGSALIFFFYVLCRGPKGPRLTYRSPDPQVCGKKLETTHNDELTLHTRRSGLRHRAAREKDLHSRHRQTPLGSIAHQ